MSASDYTPKQSSVPDMPLPNKGSNVQPAPIPAILVTQVDERTVTNIDKAIDNCCEVINDHCEKQTDIMFYRSYMAEATDLINALAELIKARAKISAKPKD